MLFKTPIRPEGLPLRQGWAVAAPDVGWLIGVKNAPATRLVPEVAPRCVTSNIQFPAITVTS